jgi:DNA primase small subunit
MPHSVSSNDLPEQDGDDILPDAPPAEIASDSDKEEPDVENRKMGVKLEDMFSDDEEDQDFPHSEVNNANIESSPPPDAVPYA